MKFTSKIILVTFIFLVVTIITIVILFGDHITKTNFKIYSADKKECVTVITNGKMRYFINGAYNSIPKTNYIKVDISNIDPIGDEIGICWKNDEYDWLIVNHHSKVVENRLDTLKYKFNTSWETDETGIINAKKYRKNNCGTIGLTMMNTFGEHIILEN